MDVFIKIWLPIISIIFTLANFIVTGFNVKRESKKYRSSLRTVYVEKIFDNHLVEKIPEIRNKIIPTTEGFDGLVQLAEEIVSMRKDILYFKYNSEKFYNKLDGTLREFEDFLSENMGKAMKIQGDQEKFQNEINKRLSSIYKQVDRHYSGK